MLFNKLQQTWWLSAEEIHSLSQFWRQIVQCQYHWAEMKVYQQGCTPSRVCREGPVPFLFQGPVASGLPWLVATSRQSSRPASSNRSLFHPHIAVSSVYIKTSSDCLLVRTLVLACGAHMDDNPGQCRCIEILHFISSLPYEVIITGSRSWTQISFGGPFVQHTTPSLCQQFQTSCLQQSPPCSRSRTDEGDQSMSLRL